MKIERNPNPLIAAGVLLGIGMGGFVDGIVFHQIFQLHNMLSNQLFPDSVVRIEVNMFWDGIFHAMTWMMTLLGLALLWRATGRRDVPHATKTLVGASLLGWGIFNSVEGVLNHHVFALHHVVQRSSGSTRTLWDLAFLASGILLIVTGGWLIRADRSRQQSHTSRSDLAA